jgi:hypothetical protein
MFAAGYGGGCSQSIDCERFKTEVLSGFGISSYVFSTDSGAVPQMADC